MDGRSRYLYIVLGDTCASYIHTVFNVVATYRYLLSTMYLFMADIVNLDLFECLCHIWICVGITRIYDEQRLSSSWSKWLAYLKHGKSGPHCLGQKVSTQFAHQLDKTTVTAPLLVGCVI